MLLSPQQDEVCAGEGGDGRQGEQGAQQHDKAQYKAEDVDNHRGVKNCVSGDDADVVQVGKPGNAVGDEPDGEEQGEHQGAGAGVEQQHDARHDAQNPRHKGDGRPKAGVFFKLDVEDDVRHAHDDGGNPVCEHHARQGKARVRKGPDAKGNQQNARCV